MNPDLKLYKTVDAQSKTVPELIVMVYGGAIDNLKEAGKQYRNQNMQAGHESLEKAKKFIVHLYTTLDEEKGGEIAANLSKLYSYLVERINFVQATKDLKTIEDAINILQNIREGWNGLVQQSKSGRGKKDDTTVPEGSQKRLSVSV